MVDLPNDRRSMRRSMLPAVLPLALSAVCEQSTSDLIFGRSDDSPHPPTVSPDTILSSSTSFAIADRRRSAYHEGRKEPCHHVPRGVIPAEAFLQTQRRPSGSGRRIRHEVQRRSRHVARIRPRARCGELREHVHAGRQAQQRKFWLSLVGEAQYILLSLIHI